MYSLFVTIIVGGIAGLIAGTIRKGSGYGVLWNIVIGIIGGAIGTIIFSLLGYDTSDTNWIGNLIVSVIGSLVLLVFASMFQTKDN